MKAYYFSDRSETLRYGDGRAIVLGETHTVKGPVELCRHGLHASIDPLDALRYAHGPILWEVELGGEIVEGGDKVVATERTYLRRIDTEELLREFARWCALQVIDQWDAPDVVRQYLETGDGYLRSAAAAAAAAAAWSAAWSAAEAARSAAAEAAEEAWSEMRGRQSEKLKALIEGAR